MRLPLSWLNELLSQPLAAETVRETLTRVGLEVESLQYEAPGLETVFVGQIVGIEAHPNADKLRVCQTDVGEAASIQIVTGATNVQLGDKIPVARVGSKLPGNKNIEAAKLRGVDSYGMYCSMVELGLPPQDDGVHILPADTTIGLPIASAMKLGELVLDVAVMANRPDTMSVLGIARELVVAHPACELLTPAAKNGPSSGSGGAVTLSTTDPERCPLYLGLNLTGVTVAPSPAWLADRLLACGMRPINNVVDATNYVMLLTGQPLHAFDVTRIRGGQIAVRLAQPGETLTTLDGVARTLDADDLVIADAERALVVAGVMGGKDAEVDDTSRDLFLEAAYFQPESVRRTSRRLGLSTESSLRFERGVDPTGADNALAILRDLILQLAGGEVVGGTLQARGMGLPKPQSFEFHLDALQRLLGMDVPNQEVDRILRALGFSLSRHTDGVFELNSYDVEAPGWRLHDTRREADLVEEVARHYGYDRIPTVLPVAVERPQQPRSVVIEQQLRHVCAGLGLSEVMTKSLTSADAEALALLDGAKSEHVRLQNPLKDMAVLRTSMLPGLMEVLRYNRYQGIAHLGIFEIGRTYMRLDGEANETPWLGGAIMGSLWEGPWLADHTPTALVGDFAYAKGVVEGLFGRLGLAAPTFEQAEGTPGLHPGRTARIVVGHHAVGYLGEVHPQAVANFDLPTAHPTSAFMIDLEALAKIPTPLARFVSFSRLPATLRDLAVVVDAQLSAGDAIAAIQSAGGDILEKVGLFDRFSGGNLPSGKVSMGFNLVFRATDRTLTAAEIEPATQRIITSLQDRFGAVLRT